MGEDEGENRDVMRVLVGDGGDQEVHVERRGGQTQALFGKWKRQDPVTGRWRRRRRNPGFRCEQCGQMCLTELGKLGGAGCDLPCEV